MRPATAATASQHTCDPLPRVCLSHRPVPLRPATKHRKPPVMQSPTAMPLIAHLRGGGVASERVCAPDRAGAERKK